MQRIQFVRAGDPQHHVDWAMLQARGDCLAVAHSPQPALGVPDGYDLWCRVLRTDNSFLTGAVISIARSRKLPTAKIARVHFAAPFVQHLGASGLRALVVALAEIRGGPSLLSIHLYAVERETREAAELIVADAGFEREPEPRTFHNTLLISVGGTHEDRLSRFSYAVRRAVRQVAERGYRISPVTDVTGAQRIAWLYREAHRRTGATPITVDFSKAIEAARQEPDRALLLGVYHPDRPPGSALVGFAHALSTGSSVVYASAGTERAADIGNTPLSYGLVATILDWTAAKGFAHFDFGGITSADEPDHPLAGITEFKRKFRGADAIVASDYRIDVRPFSAALLRTLELPVRFANRR